MFHIDNDSSVTIMPTPTSAGTPGYFSDGNPATGQQATVMPAEFMNMVMMELANLVTSAGLTLDKSDYTQVSKAVPKLIAQLATVSWENVTNKPVDLVIAGQSSLTGAVTLSSTLSVAGIATLNGAVSAKSTLSVTGATTLSSTLAVTGIATLSGAVSMASTLSVTGATNLYGGLWLTGTAAVTGSVSLGSTLGVTGAATLNSTLGVVGLASLNGGAAVTGALSVSGATTLSSTLGVTGAVTLASTLSVAGIATLTGAVSAKSTLTVTGAATLSSTLAVTGAVTLASGLSAAGAITAGGSITSTATYAFRSVGGNYGAAFYNDGSSLYLMLTNSGDQYGGYNSLRPLQVNLSSGAVTIGNGLSVTGTVAITGAVTVTGGLTTGYVTSNAHLWAVSVCYTGNGASYLNTDGNLFGPAWTGGQLYADLNTTIPYRIAAQITTGSVGSYALLRNRTGVTINPGGTSSGTLNYMATSGVEYGAAAGTWMAMGGCAAGEATVFLRKA